MTISVQDASDQPVLIEIDSLTEHFGSFVAVDHVSFKVRRGEVLGFLGPNGAGKSTTMRIIAGFITSTAGTPASKVTTSRPTASPHAGCLVFCQRVRRPIPKCRFEGFLRFCARIRGFSGSD